MQPRDNPRPCENATFAEFRAGRHTTMNDRFCDRCLSSADALGLVSSARGTRSVDGMGPATFAPTVLAPRTAPRGGSTFGEGFLSDARRPGGQLQGFPSAGTGPSEGRAVHRPT